MLMLAVRYWYNKKEDEKTYQYACRIIENPPEPTEAMPSWGFLIIKPFSLLFKRFKVAEEKAKKAFSEEERRREENIKWAREFKEWYEIQNKT